MSFRITFIQTPAPKSKNLNDKLMWFGGSIGLFSLRDKDRVSFRIFIELLKLAKNNIPISSDELAAKLGLTRGTIVHHINKLIEAHIIVVSNNRYFLRVNSLKQLIEEMKKDLEKQFIELQQVAKEIDDIIGLD